MAKAWYGKTKRTSYELLVRSGKFKSTSWNSKVWVQIHELRVQLCDVLVQIYGYGYDYGFSREQC